MTPLLSWLQNILAPNRAAKAPSRSTMLVRVFISGFATLLSIYLTNQPAKADQDLSGTWKRNCEDDFGLLIQRADNHLYSVIFCGLRACSRSWTPNTGITGDPKYRVISDVGIGIRRSDDLKLLFVYRRCADRTLLHRLSQWILTRVAVWGYGDSAGLHSENKRGPATRKAIARWGAPVQLQQ